MTSRTRVTSRAAGSARCEAADVVDRNRVHSEVRLPRSAFSWFVGRPLSPATWMGPLESQCDGPGSGRGAASTWGSASLSWTSAMPSRRRASERSRLKADARAVGPHRRVLARSCSPTPCRGGVSSSWRVIHWLSRPSIVFTHHSRAARSTPRNRCCPAPRPALWPGRSRPPRR